MTDDPAPTIRLDSFLKLMGLTPTGGQAKLLIQAGHAYVNGVPERHRSHKLRPGDVVELKVPGSPKERAEVGDLAE